MNISKAKRMLVAGAAAVAMSQVATGSTNTFKAVTSGVGLCGTNWVSYADKTNWEYPDRAGGYAADDDLGYGSAYLENCGKSAGNARYIELPESLTVHRMVGNTGYSNMKINPVLRGDGTLTYAFWSTASADSGLSALWLYSPYVLKGSSGYCGFIQSVTEICGPLDHTEFTGSAANTTEAGWSLGPRIGSATLYFNYHRFATERVTLDADGVAERNISDWQADYNLDRDAVVVLTSPCGAAEDIVQAFATTANSRFAVLAAGATATNLPVGTAVSGSGIPAGTYLKRVFPDDSIELSQAATAGGASVELTFAAVTFKTTVDSSVSRLRLQNQAGTRRFYVQKKRAEDDFEVRVLSFTHYGVNTDTALGLTIGTESGFYPGRLRIVGHCYKNSSERASTPIRFDLNNCDIVPPTEILSKDIIFRQSDPLLTARITVDTDEVRPAVGTYKINQTEVKGTLVKGGVGTFNAAFTGATGDYSGKVLVEEGTLRVANAGATLGRVELKAGARLDVSVGGVSVTELIVADGAIVAGGVLTATTVTGDAGKVKYEGGGGIRDAVKSSDPVSITLVSGEMRRYYEDGDMIVMFTTNSVFRVDGSDEADILVVGGGGGAGGVTGGGGGGGGGVVYTQNVELVNGYYSAVVGLGGKGATSRGAAVTVDGRKYDSKGSTSGGNSAFAGLTAIGGGAGGGYHGDSGHTYHPDTDVDRHHGVAGGSGGGGGVLYPANGSNRDQVGGAGTADQGNAGAKSFIRRYDSPCYVAGGGGGGAGAAAVPPGTNEFGVIYGSDGGDGRLVPIWGERYYGGGGAGSANSSTGVECKGGLGGGGDAAPASASVDANGEDGEPNTGGGGGAATSKTWDGATSYHGGNGGSGVVIVRFPHEIAVHKDQIATGGSVRRRGTGHIVHSFLDSGTFVVNEGSFVDVLVVGGGGGGGTQGGGGGGGGSVVMASNVWVNAGTYDIVVGAGGRGQLSANVTQNPARTGCVSRVSFGSGSGFSFVAPGGGRGGFRNYNSPTCAGGTGGGAGAPYPTTNYNDSSCWSYNVGKAGVLPWGYGGGNSTNFSDKTVESFAHVKLYAGAGGGGGGAGGPGGNSAYTGIPSQSNRASNGAGGAGVWCDFRGFNLEYGAGGDGGKIIDSAAGSAAASPAGTGRGGDGADYNTTSIDSYGNGGDGGGGCVVIRYRSEPNTGLLLLVK